MPRAVRSRGRGEAVAVTSPKAQALAIGMACVVCSLSLLGAILPEDRFDALYHRYDGGGVLIDGPSLLIRKQIGDSASVSANHYVDSISGASIDVVTSASPYSEKRTENSVSVSWLRNKVTMDMSMTTSRESDYDADTWSFNISQDMFGDMTTVSLGYTYGKDSVGRRDDPAFSEGVNRQQYRVGMTQVLSRNLLLDLAFETVTDEGYLNNPYRSVRYLDPASPLGYSFEREVYPRTRDSNAFGIRALYYLPYRASLRGEYRRFDDSWGIAANTYEFSYSQPFRERWILDLRYRHYRQTGADFYGDLFPAAGAQNFLARDKELSTFTNTAIGAGISYEFLNGGKGLIERGSVTISHDRLRFDYDDFRNIPAGGIAGEEPFYGFTAGVTQLYFSLWY